MFAYIKYRDIVTKPAKFKTSNQESSMVQQAVDIIEQAIEDPGRSSMVSPLPSPLLGAASQRSFTPPRNVGGTEDKPNENLKLRARNVIKYSK